MYAHSKACRPDQDRVDIGAYCPIGSMVRESYDGIIGDAPVGAIPLRRVATFRGSLRRHADTAMIGEEGMMSQQTPEQCETGRAVPAEPECGGHRRGRQQPFRGGARGPGGTAGARVRGLHGGPVPVWRTGWPSAVWRRWSWSRRECTGYRCSGRWKSGASR